MYYLLFTLYLCLAAFFLTKVPFVRKTGLSTRIIAVLFVIKVSGGVAIGWITLQLNPANDYWSLNNDGMVEYKILLNDPREFVVNIFRSPYADGYTGFFNSIGSYWNDLRYNIILKILAVCNIFSHGNYYINSIFFNFFGFFGMVALFRVFTNIYENKRWEIIAGCFLLPSVLYFTAGINKDLIIYTMIGLFFYCIYFSVTQKPTYRRLIFGFLSFAVILLIRNYVAVALIPVSLAFLIATKKRLNPLVTLLTAYAIPIVCLVILQLLLPSFQPLKVITQKQADFLDLPVAASQVNMELLEPNLGSFARNFLPAVDHGFLRPYIWQTKGTYLLPIALELLIYQILFVWALFSKNLKSNISHPFILAGIFFAVSMLTLTGFIIPNVGSIVRYKSLYLPFLIIPLLCTISWRKRS